MENLTIPQSELFAELRENLYEQPATVGQRFINYLIDIFIFYLVIFVLGAVAGLMLGDVEAEGETLFGMPVLIEYLLIYALLIGLYTFLETATKGRSIGKIITKTRAIREDGSNVNFNDALKRSLIRCIPFEQFSAFGGRPWHDRWSNTKVIRENN